MRTIKVQGAKILHAEPCSDGQPQSWLVIEDDGDDSTLDNLPPGAVLWDSRVDLASSAPDALKSHHCTFGPGLWEPLIGEDGEEYAVHAGARTYLLVLRGVEIFQACHLGDGISQIWAWRNPGILVSALGTAVVKDSGALSDDYLDGEHGPRPHPHSTLRLGQA